MFCFSCSLDGFEQKDKGWGITIGVCYTPAQCLWGIVNGNQLQEVVMHYTVRGYLHQLHEVSFHFCVTLEDPFNEQRSSVRAWRVTKKLLTFFSLLRKNLSPLALQLLGLRENNNVGLRGSDLVSVWAPAFPFSQVGIIPAALLGA